MARRKAATKIHLTPAVLWFEMAFTAEEVARMLDSSDESEIEEDPLFMLPHESDSEHEEFFPCNSTTTVVSSISGTNEDSDTSDEDIDNSDEDISQGIVNLYSP